ncbi:MAG: ROK family protein [Planctomycetes bacterium]|nr:ROK family protein [Planctomycetota bacterium]
MNAPLPETAAPPAAPAARTPELRRENAWRVLEALRSSNAPRSAPELADSARVTRPTVDAALSLLRRKRFVQGAPERPSSGGRPAAQVEPAPNGAWTVAVSFFIPEIAGVVLDLNGQPVARAVRRVNVGASSIAALRALEDVLAECLDLGAERFGAQHAKRLRGVALAVAGTLSADKRTSLAVARVSGWKAWPLAEHVERLLAQRGCTAPVVLERYLSALGEALPPAEGGVRLCVEVGSGVGVAMAGLGACAGVNAGEFGFTRLDASNAAPSDATGRRGTVEAFLADPNVRKAAEAAGVGAKGGDEELYAALGRALNEDHPYAQALAERYAQALANLADLFAPGVIQVRGAVHAAGEVFRARVAERLNHYALTPCALEWTARDTEAPALALGRAVLAQGLRAALFEDLQS